MSVMPHGKEVDRRSAYRDLVRRRKLCGRCPSLTNPSVIGSGAFDSEEIGPYSTWQADLHPELVVVARDFAPVHRFIELGGRPGTRIRTNVRLERFLASAGYSIGKPDAPSRGSGVFLTNAVLCLAGGDSMRTTVPGPAIRTCALHFLEPLVRLLAPKVVVSLGKQATEAVLGAFRVSPVQDFAALTQAPEGIEILDSTRLYPVPHPAASRRLAEHEASWARLGSRAA